MSLVVAKYIPLKNISSSANNGQNCNNILQKRLTTKEKRGLFSAGLAWCHATRPKIISHCVFRYCLNLSANSDYSISGHANDSQVSCFSMHSGQKACKKWNCHIDRNVSFKIIFLITQSESFFEQFCNW